MSFTCSIDVTNFNIVIIFIPPENWQYASNFIVAKFHTEFYNQLDKLNNNNFALLAISISAFIRRVIYIGYQKSSHGLYQLYESEYLSPPPLNNHNNCVIYFILIDKVIGQFERENN